jgi:hypothetical protein
MTHLTPLGQVRTKESMHNNLLLHNISTFPFPPPYPKVNALSTMFQEFVDKIDRTIAKDRATSYLGSACVRFQDLDFSFYSSEDDSSNIRRLSDIFEKAGCFTLKAEYRIAALIDRTVFENAIRISNISAEQIRQPPDGHPPQLSFLPGYKLKCLQGRSRVRAAEANLDIAKHSWAVDFYAEGMCCEIWFKGDS